MLFNQTSVWKLLCQHQRTRIITPTSHLMHLHNTTLVSIQFLQEGYLSPARKLSHTSQLLRLVLLMCWKVAIIHSHFARQCFGNKRPRCSADNGVDFLWRQKMLTTHFPPQLGILKHDEPCEAREPASWSENHLVWSSLFDQSSREQMWLTHFVYLTHVAPALSAYYVQGASFSWNKPPASSANGGCRSDGRWRASLCMCVCTCHSPSLSTPWTPLSRTHSRVSCIDKNRSEACVPHLLPVLASWSLYLQCIKPPPVETLHSEIALRSNNIQGDRLPWL